MNKRNKKESRGTIWRIFIVFLKNTKTVYTSIFFWLGKNSRILIPEPNIDFVWRSYAQTGFNNYDQRRHLVRNI